MGIEAKYTEEDLSKYQDVGTFVVPDFVGKTKKDMKDLLKIYEFGEVYSSGEGEVVTEQFPLPGDSINRKSGLVLYY
jgi:stage V sporulation protein D (sporulation-specific penicillin-binding protein)